MLTLTGLTTTIDPSESYYTDTSSILNGLITRSLTQYKYDPTSKQMILVPDLATDLGTHNDNYTKWTFTIRPGVKWGENGKEITAKDVAFGMTRCMDAATFPTGACQYYSNAYFKGGADYKGMYTDPGSSYKGITVDGDTITIKMDKPFPDMPYWGTFPANGPIPEGKVSDPKTYKNHPLVRRSLHDQEVQPRQGARAREEPLLGRQHGPGAHAVPRRVRLQAAAALGEDRPDPDRRLR